MQTIISILIGIKCKTIELINIASVRYTWYDVGYVLYNINVT